MKVNQFQPYIGQEEYEAIKSCFDANWITEGPKSKEFSESLLNLTGSKYGVFAQNGTLALYLALRAVGVKPEDEVIVPNFTFIASANAVEMCGATPVFVDINENSLQINVEDCQRALSSKTKAIMPVHIFGLCANMDQVMEFSKTNNLKVVEDAAQGIGITWGGKHSGTFGDAGCFSFFADKTITTGEGGYVTSNNKEVYENMLYLRNQGRLNRGSFIHPEIGYNFRITDIQAAMGLVQMRKLDEIIIKKKNILKLYKEGISDVEGVKIIEPEPDSKSNHIPFRVVIMTEEKSKGLGDYFSENEIETRTVFYPLHKQPCFSNKFVSDDNNFPNSNKAYDHGLCLPSYPALEENKINFICDTIKKYLSK